MDTTSTTGRVIFTPSRIKRWVACVAGGIAVLVLLPVVALMILIAGLGESTVGKGGGIPAVYAPMYQAAAAAYHVNPFVLAALHKTESDYSRNPAAFRPTSAGALGPMQFLPSTWSHYADAYRPIAGLRPTNYPHMCAPHGCITDDFDAIAAAADYLHQLGADANLDPRTLEALVRYKGTPPASIPYARETFILAQELEAANVTTGGSIVQTPSEPLADRLVTVADEIAAAHIPYCYGGGHVTPARPTHGTYCHSANNEFISGEAYDGLDCSSSVSMLLQQSGVSTPTLDSIEFMSFGRPGIGWFTVWANPDHVFVTFAGRAWGTSDANPQGGPGWAPQSTVGFVPRHLASL
jgi:hypothetical protein